MKRLVPHALADRLPEMQPDEFVALKEAILASGQLEAIVLLDGKILDGRHRYLACRELKIEPKVVDFKRAWGDPVEYVISKSSHRNMVHAQVACVAEAFMDDLVARRKAAGEDISGRSDEYTGRRFGIASKCVKEVRHIRKQSPELYELMRTGKCKVREAYSRLKHNVKRREVRQIRSAANVTIADCDLREGDNLGVMRAMPDGCARVVFADPPYNNGWQYRSDPTRDRRPDVAYLDDCRGWMTQAARLLSHDGSLFVLIDDNYSDHFGLLLRGIGLIRRPTIVCWETFANYNSAETSLSQNARYLHWFTKSEHPLINTIEARVPSDRQTKYADKRGVDHGRLPPNVWPLVRVTSQDKERCPWLGQRGNAPQLPRALPERAILLASNAGDLVVDPFNGNGITGIAALANARRYVGIDRDAKGLEQSRSWIAHELARLQGA